MENNIPALEEGCLPEPPTSVPLIEDSSGSHLRVWNALPALPEQPAWV